MTKYPYRTMAEHEAGKATREQISELQQKVERIEATVKSAALAEARRAGLSGVAAVKHAANAMAGKQRPMAGSIKPSDGDV